MIPDDSPTAPAPPAPPSHGSGIVSSGTGSDGLRGVPAIQEAGGAVLVQDSASASFDGLPRNASSTGLVDFVLPPEELAVPLLALAAHPRASPGEGSDAILTHEEGMARIFSMLREKTGVDFTYYKPSTLVRRLEARMRVHQVEELADYVRYLVSSPRELNTLYRELFIGVTSFFRDGEAFACLEQYLLPELFERAVGGELRLWVAGCSTGEEAYSMAILCRRYLDRASRRFDVKIFATDIAHDAVARAEQGVYPESLADELPPDVLALYFQRHGEGYEVTRSLRELVVFTQHNVVKDPPFTRIDLCSCRNLLLYLQPVLQKEALSRLQFALRPGGILFLGSSETTGEAAEHFEPVQARWKLYRSKGPPRPLTCDPEV